MRQASERVDSTASISGTNVPETVSNSTEMDFGDLTVSFTTTYAPIWDDSGSTASKQVAFWRPKPPKDFFFLGDIAVSNYDSIDNKIATIVVKDNKNQKGKPLAKPDKFECIWKNSGMSWMGDKSCWRPVPPDGYVALGDVYSATYDPPNIDEFRCVRKDLAFLAKIGDKIWDDSGSAASEDFSVWSIDTPRTYNGEATGLFAVNAFKGKIDYDKPTGGPEVWVLNLPLPTVNHTSPTPPTLESRQSPPESTEEILEHQVYLPCTAIRDDEYTPAWQVKNSPFYVMERWGNYKLEMFHDNRTNTPQETREQIRVGVSKSIEKEFRRSVGVSVTYNHGVAANVGPKASATLTVELGWRTQTNVTQFKERTLTKTLVAPPDTAAAIWYVSYTLKVKRINESYLPQLLPFTVDAFVTDQFPK